MEGKLVDIGIVTVPDTLPGGGARPGRGRQSPATRVTAVGYPLGGRLTLSHGRLAGATSTAARSTRAIAFDGQVMQLSARVKHGNSGGPVLDAKGRVVGVIYAGQFDPGQDYSQVAYALPLRSVDQLLSSGGTQAVLPCEQ